MVFRKFIDLYAGDDFYIAEDVRARTENQVDREQDYVNRYDEYIVEGRDLAHGKLVN